MAREPWYDSGNPSRVARGAGWRIALWILAGVLFFGAIGGGIWAFRVATADVKGRGDVEIKDKSAPNRIKAQEQFYVMYNGIVAADKNLDVLKATVTAHPNDRIAQVTYDGAVLGCNSAVASYNAETHKITSRNWLDPELPYEIDGSDQATDCKPTGGTK